MPHVETTRLVMDPISDADLAAYSGHRRLGRQSRGVWLPGRLDWVHILKGSESNVVGLPMELLEQMLQRLPSPVAIARLRLYYGVPQ